MRMIAGKRDFIGRELEQHIRQWARQRVTAGDNGARTVCKALRLAKHHHTGQRKNGDPEINHPLTVAYLFTKVAQACVDHGFALPPDIADGVTGMLCHDILEDKNVTRAALRQEIGERAEQTVYGMSKKYLNDDGVLIYKDAGSQEALWDLIADPFALAGRYLDRSHNLGTMVEIDGTFLASRVVYDPDKQVRKLREAVFELIPAGDPAVIATRYDPLYCPLVSVAQAYLIATVSDVFGRCASADMLRTFQEWRNTAHQEKLLDSIRFPDEGDTLHTAFARLATKVPSVLAHPATKRNPANANMALAG